MPPTLALALWFILLVALLRFDPAKEPGTSVALWVPVLWMFTSGSRLPSQWLGDEGVSQAQAFQEGNPLDRAIYFLLILLALAILMRRGFHWGDFIRRNLTLVLLLSFALASVVWSDFPFISFKRWFRDLGNYLVVLVVVSDPSPLEAVGVVLRRLCYLLLPLSILLIKYYTYLAVHYSPWSGAQEFVGASTSKNMLGVVCLVSGIYLFWDTIRRWSSRKERGTKWVIRLNAVFLVMVFWLLNLSHSATSEVCLVLGCLVIVAVHSGWGRRHHTFVKFMSPAIFCLYLILAYGFGINGKLAERVGRDATLTGRSEIWKAVLGTHTNPWIGTGYESFWLGPRLARVWETAGAVNEAHNGYLEVYLNLGLIGDFLVILFLLTSYWIICKKLSPSFQLGSLALGLWTLMLFYNMTESAAFSGQILWVSFVMIMIAVAAYKPVSLEPAPVRKLVPAKGRLRVREGVTA